MKENQIQINDRSAVKRTYLQIARTGKFLPVLILSAVLLCAALWFFCGQRTANVTGYCETTGATAVLMIPTYERPRLKPGDPVWIGNEAGTIEAIFDERYYTYRDISASDSMTFRNFLNSGLCDEDTAYILASAVFEKDMTGRAEYRIVTDTKTHFQQLTGRAKHE